MHPSATISSEAGVPGIPPTPLSLETQDRGASLHFCHRFELVRHLTPHQPLPHLKHKMEGPQCTSAIVLSEAGAWHPIATPSLT